jgi:hypothetical protein
MGWISGTLWRAVNRPGAIAYRKALRAPRAAQERLLKSCLQRNARTAFGRRYGFGSIRSVSDYQSRVPLSTYDDVAPWIERAAAGEPRVLTREPVLHLALSSGSARAAKLIPYTAALQAEFRRAVAPWMDDLLSRRPDFARGPAYWSISPVAREARRSPAGIPIGFEEDSSYLGGLWKWLVDGMMAVPSRVGHIQDMDRFWRETALHLLRCRGLRIISVWHPSFLELLLDAAERILGSVLDVNRTWPRLGLISCWGDGHAAAPMEALRRRFPRVEIQPKGLIATEGIVTLPFEGRTPVAIRSHFFEFLDDSGRPRLAHELESDREYSVVLTTGGGLYRYRLQDRVSVDGRVEATPSLRFLGKEDRVSDLRGEKLSEGFVAGCQRDVFRQHGLTPSFSLLAPADDSGRYLLFVESSGPLPESLAVDLDRSLQRNPHYRYCRDLGQLASPQVVPVAGGGYLRYLQRCRTLGQRAGDIKPCALDPLSGWAEILRS